MRKYFCVVLLFVCVFNSNASSGWTVYPSIERAAFNWPANRTLFFGKLYQGGPTLIFDLNGQQVGNLTDLTKNFANFQNIDEQFGIIKVSRQNKVLYFDSNNGFKQIGQEYASGTLFSEGLAIVSSANESLKIINQKGEVLAWLNEYKAAIIEEAYEFKNGLAAFKNSKNLWGFIDYIGKVIIEPIYSKVSDFNEGYCVVQQNIVGNVAVGIIDKKGNSVYNLTTNLLLANQVTNGKISFKNGKNGCGVMEPNGKIIIEPNPIFEWVLPYTNKDFSIFMCGKKYGVLDSKGEILVRAKFDFIQLTGKEFIGTSIDLGVKTDIYKLNGNKVKNIPYLILLSLSNGNYIAVEKEGAVFLDKNLKEISKNTIFGANISGGYSIEKQPARNNYFNTKDIASILGSKITNNSINGLQANDNVIKMIEKFGLAKTKDYSVENEIYNENQLAEMELNSNLGKHNTLIFGKIESKYFDDNLSDAEKEERSIMDSIEMAVRMADSLAALESIMMVDGDMEEDENRYYDSLNFLTDLKIQRTEFSEFMEFLNCEVSLNYSDNIKLNIFEEKNNACNTCKLIGTKINPNAKLVGYNLKISLYGKAQGKNDEFLNNFIEKLKSKGYVLEKTENEYTIYNTKLQNKKCGYLKLPNIVSNEFNLIINF